MEDEKQLSEKESLALIASMINKAKNSYIDSGIGPLFWGILITVCSLVTYAQGAYNFEIGFDIWLISLLALIPQIYFNIRGRKNKNYICHEDSMMNYVWGTFGVCIFITTFYINKVGSSNAVALHMMLFGMPTFITGGIRKFKPMIIGGLVCWICSISSYYVGYPNRILLMGVSATAAWLIPGIILRRKYLKLAHV